MRSVPEPTLRKGRNLGLTRRQLFTSVMLPAAMPHIFTGIQDLDGRELGDRRRR